MTHGHYFNRDNVKILYHETTEKKEEFIEMLFMKEEGNKAIISKKDFGTGLSIG